MSVMDKPMNLIRGCSLVLLLAASAWGQEWTTRSALEGLTPKALEPGSPAGAYALTGFDT